MTFREIVRANGGSVPDGDLTDEWVEGYLAALHHWAWWKDGRRYVGDSTLFPLENAVRALANARTAGK